MKNKNNIKKIRRDYLKIPTKLCSLNLSAYSIAIFVIMIDCEEGFNPSIKFIGKKIGLSKNTVVKYINELLSTRVIKKLEQGDYNKVSVYSFNHPDLWIKLDNIETTI